MPLPTAPRFLHPPRTRLVRLAVAATVSLGVVVAQRVARANPCTTTEAPRELPSPRAAYTSAKRAVAERRWNDALPDLHAVAFRYPDEDFAAEASVAYVKTLGAVEQDGCLERIEADLPKLEALHCAGPRANAHAEACHDLDLAAADVASLRVAIARKRADHEGSPAAYVPVATASIEAFRVRCEVPAAASRPPRAKQCLELAYDAATAFRAARLAPAAIDALARLVAYDAKVGARSPLATEAHAKLGEIHESLTSYALAAESYETYARLAPSQPAAERVLSTAIVLRLGTSDLAHATADTELYLNLYGAKKVATAASVVLALASYAAEHGDLAAAATTLRKRDTLFASAPLDLRIRERVLLARAEEPRAGAARTRASYETAVALYGDGRQLAESLAGASADESELVRARRLGRALGAVGEAKVAIADAVRRETVDTLVRPVLTGPTDDAHLHTFVASARPWMVAKTRAIMAAEGVYTSVLAIEPVPPPSAVIAASAKVAAMWASYEDDVARLVPLRTVRDRANGAAVVAALRDPIRDGHVLPAYRACVALSMRYQYTDPLSRACERWLVSHRALVATDELVPALRVGAPRELAPPVLRAPAE